ARRKNEGTQRYGEGCGAPADIFFIITTKDGPPALGHPPFPAPARGVPPPPPMTFDARLADAWSRLPDYLGSHVLVSLTALAIGLGISLPIAIASRHRPVLRAVLLGAASVVQTIPGLALLALFYPLLLAIAS